MLTDFRRLPVGVERGFSIRISKAFAVIRKQRQPSGQEGQTDECDDYTPTSNSEETAS
jgi:hypothetical protein